MITEIVFESGAQLLCNNRRIKWYCVFNILGMLFTGLDLELDL